MFDIGFTEIVVVSIVGLLVIGPERLPDTIRTIALWIGRLKRTSSRLFQEIEREVGIDEVRKQLHNEKILDSLKLNDEPSLNNQQQNKVTRNPPKAGSDHHGNPQTQALNEPTNSD